MDLKNFVFPISTLLDLVKVLFDTLVQWSEILYQQKLGMLLPSSSKVAWFLDFWSYLFNIYVTDDTYFESFNKIFVLFDVARQLFVAVPNFYDIFYFCMILQN